MNGANAKAAPSNRLVDVGDRSQQYTLTLNACDLHYLTEVAIMELDTHGSTRQLLHGSLTGHGEVMRRVFDVSKRAYGHRQAADVGMAVDARLRLSDAGVKGVLAAIRERHGEQTELVRKGMVCLGGRLAEQTGIEWSIGVDEERTRR